MSLLLVSFVASQETEKRSSLLNKRAGNRNAFQKSTTTTTEANYDVIRDGKVLFEFFSKIFEIFQEEEYAEGDAAPEEAEENLESDASSSTTSTTTESDKKVRPSVRPFRSNEDLLSALKKRRLIEKNNKASGERSKWVD